MTHSPCVLMGEGFWNYIGGKGTWTKLIAIFQEIGKAYRKRIKEEYLELD